MNFSQDIIELPKVKLSRDLRADIVCNPDAIGGLIMAHTASPVSADISSFARHLSAKAKSCLSKLGLRRITAALFVSKATNQYWAINKSGDLCRMVPDQVTDGTIDAFGDEYTDLNTVYNMGRLEASMF